MPFHISTYQDVALYAFNQYSANCPTPSILSDEWDWPVDSFMGVTKWSPEICLGKRLRNQILDIVRMRFWDVRENYHFLDPPSISWIDPHTLIPHERTSPTHLARLIEHLKRLEDDALLPTIIVSKSKPHVILDGHHRWQSSIHLGISRVPCWLVDDILADADPFTLLPVPLSQYYNVTYLAKLYQHDFQEHYTYYRLGVYDTRTSTKIRIHQVTQSARFNHLNAQSNFGVKGTKHVAIPVVWSSDHSSPSLESPPTSEYPSSSSSSSSSLYDSKKLKEKDIEMEEELRLELVAPRIEWGYWKRSGQGPFYLRGMNVQLFRNFDSNQDTSIES